MRFVVDLPHEKTKIAAFRPENLLQRTSELSAQHGFGFFGFPVFDLVAREEALHELEVVFKEGVDILVFTSANGVIKAFELYEGKIDLKKNLQDLNVELCAIGPVTRDELQKKGLYVHFMPAAYSTEGLKALFSALGVKDKRIVFLRSSEGNKEITEFLKRAGAFVTDIVVYKLKKKSIEDLKNLFEDLVEYKPNYIIFTSSMTFEIVFELANELNRAEEIFSDAKLAAIGDLTAETITGKGLKVDLIAKKNTFESLLNAIEEDAQ